jgi:signal transduction histidine kinase
MSFEPEYNNIAYLIENNGQVFYETAKLKGVTIYNTVSSELIVRSDIAMTSTVLRNLLSNAIKYTGAGKKIEIGVYSDGQLLPMVMCAFMCRTTAWK